MPVVMMYDIIVFKTSVFILSHVNEKLAFSKISTVGTVLEKPAILVPVSVWMEGWNVEKNLCFQNIYQDMCGQGLTDDQK